MRPCLKRMLGMLAFGGVLAACVEEGTLEFEGPSPGSNGQLTVALEEATPAAKAFQVRLYREMPTDLGQKPYYQSPCAGLGPGFTINRLAEGKGYVLVLEAFSGETCGPGTLVAQGIRGDVEVLAEGTGKAIYYVQLNRLGQVTEMPVPPPSLLDSGVACISDADCQGVEACPDEDRADCFQEDCLPTEECEGGVKWVRFRVHPSARCLDQTCRLESLHPLNGRWPRAFHAAAAFGGLVRVYGGFQEAQGNTLVTDSVAAAESFDSGLFLFEEQDLGSSLGASAALMASARTSNGRLLTFGGTSVLGDVNRGGVVMPEVRNETCVGAACVLKPTGDAYAIDLASGTVTRSTLEFQGAGGVAVGIPGPGALVRPGLLAGENNRQSVGRGAWRCLLAEDDTLSCLEFPGSENSVARLQPAIACLTTDRTACTEVVVLGGNVRTAPIGELYRVAENRFLNLAPVGTAPATLDGAVAVELGEQVWTFGGRLTDSIDAPPYAFNIDPAEGTITAREATLNATDLDLLLRVGHQVTPLKDGKRALVSGGIGPGGKVWDQAVLVEAEAGNLKVLRAIPMAPRAFHQAVRLEGGLMEGAVVLTGGLRALQGGDPFAAGAALYLP